MVPLLLARTEPPVAHSRTDVPVRGLAETTPLFEKSIGPLSISNVGGSNALSSAALLRTADASPDDARAWATGALTSAASSIAVV
ncbi:hypothetical protein [Sphingomonas sp. BK235]|uniref:hypothetical protein n=1 Tax=Sphingomonas sp. BK235 TaxID=2512131 RepID=UPI001044DDE8|nr:hypothetical protein [Sphingomonas sp. BK235]